MKKLLLIRHAQASPHNESDFERMLTMRGIKEANSIANKLKQLGLVPDFLLSSPAKRTHSTASIVVDNLKITNKGYDERIYDASTFTLLKVINDIDNEYDFAAIVGHNPGIAQIILELTGNYRDMPTAAAVLISFEVNEWALVHSNTGTISYYVIPS